MCLYHRYAPPSCSYLRIFARLRVYHRLLAPASTFFLRSGFEPVVQKCVRLFSYVIGKAMSSRKDTRQEMVWRFCMLIGFLRFCSQHANAIDGENRVCFTSS